MKIIVGLGNPGARYAGTRHNVGFVVLDEMARRLNTGFNLTKYHGVIAEARVAGEKILLLKPETFMNLSGQSVARAVRYNAVERNDLLVVLDDVELPVGRLRLRPQGSAGGHNGLKSIIEHLGDDRFPRLRLGVGREAGGELVDHVLGRFTPDERIEVERMVPMAADAVVVFIEHGLERAMSEYNRK